MKSIEFGKMLHIIKPEYVFLRLKPNNSIRNQNTHKLARSIAALHKNIFENIRKEEIKVKRVFGKTVWFPTKVSYQLPPKVAFLIYVEKKKIEFYFVIPRHHVSVIKEKMSDVWTNVTIEEVKELPTFQKASQYQLAYAKEDALSLAVDRRNNDLLMSTLNIVDAMQDGDRAEIFYNFIPTSQFGWRARYRSTIDKVKDHLPVDRDKTGTGYMLKIALTFILGFANTLAELFAGEKKQQERTSSIERVLERLSGVRQISESTQRKANSAILNTQIIIMSESPDALRQRNNARSLAQAFDTITEDNALRAHPYRKTVRYEDYAISGAAVNKIGDEEAQNFLALPGREVLERYNVIERVETQETEVPEDLQSGVVCIGTNTFRGHGQPAYLSTDREYQNLTLVLIGPTRAGKSTLIGNLGKDAVRAGECMVILDFIKNCELSSEIAALFPPDKVLTIECGDLRNVQGLGYNEIGRSADPLEQYDNTKRSATQLQTLVNAIVTNDAPLTPKMKRYLQSAALIVFISGGSIRDVFEVLQDHEARKSFIDQVPDSQKANLSKYILSLSEIDEHDKKEENVTGTKYALISGIVDRLNELEQNTYLERMLETDTARNVDLVTELQKNQLICIRMPEWAYPTDGERDVICSYWMTKLWLALQIRGHRIPDRGRVTKVNLVIDELYQVKTTEKLLTEKLSRLAKFGLKPIISCHYLNQISGIRNELRSANASYMLISGCDKKNYEELKSELYPYQEEDLLKLPRYHSLNLIKCKDGYARFITKLPPPIC